jgi:hypothetical protein
VPTRRRPFGAAARQDVERIGPRREVEQDARREKHAVAFDAEIHAEISPIRHPGESRDTF